MIELHVSHSISDYVHVQEISLIAQPIHVQAS